MSTMDTQLIKSGGEKISELKLATHRLTFLERVLLRILTRSCLQELGIKGLLPGPFLYTRETELREIHSENLIYYLRGCEVTFFMTSRLSLLKRDKCPSQPQPPRQSKPGSATSAPQNPPTSSSNSTMPDA